MIGKQIRRTVCLFVLLVSVIVGVVVMSGCGSTQLVNLWSDTSYKAAPLHKVLVVAMRKDPVRRRMWEDAFVAALGKQPAGTEVRASYQLFPDAVPDTAALAENSKDQGFDGVLMVSRVTRDLQTSDVPGYITTEPRAVFKRRWNTYVTRYDTIYHPGYTDTSKIVSVRTDLLLAQEDGRLVWSATSKSVDPASPAEFRNGVADKVARQLMKSQLVH